MKLGVRVFPLVLLALALLSFQAHTEALVTDEVARALQREGMVSVLIKLKDPAASPAAPQLRQQQIAGIQNLVLSSLDESDFEVIYQFKVVCGMAGRLKPSGLEKLRMDPNVERIYLDQMGEAHLNESVPLIQADVVQNMGLTGEDIVVAVLDTGVDTDHPNLNDGDIVAQRCYLDANTNQSCSGNSAEDDNGHGTNVCSIITSNGTNGGVGVAPDADIIAIKCLDRFGKWWLADVIAALDWINGEYTGQIDIINMSIGTYNVYHDAAAAETDYPNLTAELNYARNTKGIIPFASSGNGGESDSLCVPAAISHVVSVGAVYDANVGTYTWSGVCSDATTTQDKVACWSNSCSILDLLAPGCKISTSCMGGGTCWWCGTSQASPHAAGAAALLLEHNSSLTPDQIESYLENYGKDIVDSKNSLTFPRIDVLRVLDKIWIKDASWDDGSVPTIPAGWYSPDIILDPEPPTIGEECTITVTWHNFTALPQMTSVTIEIHDPNVNLAAGQPCLYQADDYAEVPPEDDQSRDFTWTPDPNSFGEGHYCVIAYIQTTDGMDVVRNPFPPKDNNVGCHNFHLQEASTDTLTFKAGNCMGDTAVLYLHLDDSGLTPGCTAVITYPEDSAIPLLPGEWLVPPPQLIVYVPDTIPGMVDDTVHVTSTLISQERADTLRHGITSRIIHVPSIWHEDFNDCDISDWTVITDRSAIFEASSEEFVSPPCGLKMVSQGDSRAFGRSPAYTLDFDQEYRISFWFRLPATNNHWFAVLDNNCVHLVIDYSTDLKTWDGSAARLVKTLSTDQWYFIECKVHPSAGNYDVYVDGDSLVRADFLNTPADDYLTVGDIHAGATDHGEGFWDDFIVYGQDTLVTAIGDLDIMPGGVVLFQNYPNPFNPVTWINYYLPRDCRVILEIYDVMGRKVATLIDAQQTAGYQTARWSAASVSSGVYILRLKAGEEIRTRKVVLMK
ncbi:MAG: S8 family serine peptidase [Candidatus Krumholzibacteriota bacterium]|nr:S8 family serine peptidase [Candidatus Krumholzibacteriota bacterium]